MPGMPAAVAAMRAVAIVHGGRGMAFVSRHRSVVIVSGVCLGARPSRTVYLVAAVVVMGVLIIATGGCTGRVVMLSHSFLLEANQAARCAGLPALVVD
ncbi:hypothetical protein FB562_0486 [Homoserinimonas aerilata]|uniref:Uncharacterized protein n=1 Tax=Homoserinimonas aerilata TaxID=1162970 RepID=A0A542YH82_9MICO|nr:hypothetical protein [Homoserinimonas aerilata]TQL47426.1 hypothetical protein FB562_0486 [Homoserinimonas aerilata]